MADNVVYPVQFHARASASSGKSVSGRGTSGQDSSIGQFIENQRSARSSRPTLMSEPSSNALIFFPSLKTRELTVERGTSSISAYRRATTSNCSMPDMPPISVNLPAMSTVKLPDALSVGSGYSTGMDLRLILKNIDWRLKVLQLSDNAASIKAGTPDAIRNIRRKVAGEMPGDVTRRTLEKLAVALECTSADLQRPSPAENIHPIPGLRGQLMAQLAFLNQERERVARQLDALDEAEAEPKKARKRKKR
jgi:hypothetical protein